MDAERPQLEATLDFVREGDALVITKIDRIACSVAHLCAIEARLHAKGASLKVLNPQLDTATHIGRLVFNMVSAIAQFEREIMLERQREGIAKAKAEGTRKSAPMLGAQKEKQQGSLAALVPALSMLLKITSADGTCASLSSLDLGAALS